MVTIRDEQLNMGKIATSGQCFRFLITEDNSYELIAFGKVLFITGCEDGTYKLSCDRREYNSIWKHYFDMETDYNAFGKQVPATDKFLRAAVRYSKGIRILNQDKWEMLISFIISQRKSIPAIQTSIEKLCKLCGDKIKTDHGIRYAFPSPKQMASLSLEDIESCSVGYRAVYIYKAAGLVASGQLDLEQLDSLPDEELRAELLKLYGVGIKVANCVMLFGYHRIGSFPIDVWIQKMIDEHYDGKFPLERYEGYAGVVQQYIFFYGRESSRIREK